MVEVKPVIHEGVVTINSSYHNITVGLEEEKKEEEEGKEGEERDIHYASQ